MILSTKQAENKDKEPIPAEILMALGLGWWPWWNSKWEKRCQITIKRYLRRLMP